jgi:hypothetical protein
MVGFANLSPNLHHKYPSNLSYDMSNKIFPTLDKHGIIWLTWKFFCNIKRIKIIFSCQISWTQLVNSQNDIKMECSKEITQLLWNLNSCRLINTLNKVYWLHSNYLVLPQKNVIGELLRVKASLSGTTRNVTPWFSWMLCWFLSLNFLVRNTNLKQDLKFSLNVFLKMICSHSIFKFLLGN